MRIVPCGCSSSSSSWPHPVRDLGGDKDGDYASPAQDVVHPSMEARKDYLPDLLKAILGPPGAPGPPLPLQPLCRGAMESLVHLPYSNVAAAVAAASVAVADQTTGK